ncbi:hypothetical protein CL648_01230 [bacterium]|nr:hypothetical protein [bacterium]
MGILIAIGLPVLAALSIGVFRLKRWVFTLSFISALGSVASLYTQVSLNQVYTRSWMPNMLIDLSFMADGLSLFFGYVVSVMGCFILFYAKHYLPKVSDSNPRFYAYILLFMSAMLGTLFSNNLILLFIFWELTGVISFLLIGFNTHTEKGRIGSRMAFIVTATTGLILLVGVLLLGILYQTFDISLISRMPALDNTVWSTLAFSFILIGVIGKSAQFPLHFWLPNAMAAPTPVSAYLHSAAMVKLGVFLVARCYPILSSLDYWYVVGIIGLITMVVGAVLALLTYDLKGILAYTTVSQLGYLIGFYGLGGSTGVEHDFFHILNHVLYKGSLFMVAGIVIHAFHTQDIRKMGNAFSAMPLAAIACVVSAASMAGIPGTTGFLSKELMLAHMLHHPNYPILIGALVVSASCLVATAFRLCLHIFLPSKTTKPVESQSVFFQLPPFILAMATLIIGLFPKSVTHFLSQASVAGLHIANPHTVSLWHGITPELIISLCITLSGIIIYTVFQSFQWRATVPGILQLDAGFNRGITGLSCLSKWLNRRFLVDSIRAHISIVLVFFVALMAPLLFALSPSIQISNISIVYLPLLIITGTAAIIVSMSKKWHVKLIALSVVGLLVSFVFFLYRAPDLVLTQLLIEIVSLVLLLLFFKKFSTMKRKKDHAVHDRSGLSFLKALVSIGVGGIVFVLIQVVNRPSADNPIGQFFIENTRPLAGGSNAVNTILVDFRGFDTLGEISVLFIAMVGVMGLLWNKRS